LTGGPEKVFRFLKPISPVPCRPFPSQDDRPHPLALPCSRRRGAGGAGSGRLGRTEPHPGLKEPAPRRQECQPKHAAHLAVRDLAPVPRQPRRRPGLHRFLRCPHRRACACSSSWSSSPTRAGGSSASTSPTFAANSERVTVLDMPGGSPDYRHDCRPEHRTAMCASLRLRSRGTTGAALGGWSAMIPRAVGLTITVSLLVVLLTAEAQRARG
jgi:hypothetical protein